MDIIFRIESQVEFEKAIEEAVNNYNQHNTTITSDPNFLKAVKGDIKQLLLDCEFDTNRVPELLNTSGWNREKIAFFVELLNNKKTELLYASLINQNSEYGETLTNFDWVLKLVLGTSELNTLKLPLLQLMLFTESNGIHKTLSYDVNRDMILKLINTLETLEV